MGKYLPFLIFAGIYILMRVLAGKAGQSQRGSAPRPPAGKQPPDMQPRPPDQGQRSERLEWTARQEQVDRYLQPSTEPERPVQTPPQQPGPMPQMPRPQPGPAQQIPVPGGQQQQPSSPLGQILQLPAQIAAAQERMAREREQIARERAALQRQRNELLAESMRQRAARPAAVSERAAPVPRPAAESTAFRNVADLRRAIVLAEVLGPPKALRRKPRPRAGLI